MGTAARDFLTFAGLLSACYGAAFALIAAIAQRGLPSSAALTDSTLNPIFAVSVTVNFYGVVLLAIGAALMLITFKPQRA